jgi:hypothetical protein
MIPITEENFKIIKKQLGREPQNLLGVARTCPFDKPAILITNPYEEARIFPTTYWLSCPYLVKKVSHIEDTGLIKELTTQLKKDKRFKSELEKAHKNYAKKRLSYLSADLDLDQFPDDIRKVLTNSGVGGIRNKEGIKCLHTHLADYMVNQKNPVGELVDEMVDWPQECECCD